MKRRTAESGFTLLELLMVVIIIAILAALALPAYFRAVEKARTSEATIAMGALKGAIQRECVESAGAIPPAFANLDVEDPNLVANAQFSYVINTPPTICAAGGAGFVANITATRIGGGPCAGSTVVMQYPPGTPGASPFTYTWLGTCA